MNSYKMELVSLKGKKYLSSLQDTSLLNLYLNKGEKGGYVNKSSIFNGMDFFLMFFFSFLFMLNSIYSMYLLPKNDELVLVVGLILLLSVLMKTFSVDGVTYIDKESNCSYLNFNLLYGRKGYLELFEVSEVIKQLENMTILFLMKSVNISDYFVKGLSVRVSALEQLSMLNSNITALVRSINACSQEEVKVLVKPVLKGILNLESV